MTPFQIKTAGWLFKESEVKLDINKGDVLLGGKYKNSPITVEEIGTDELGQPTVNGRKLLAYRIKKKMPEKTALLKIAKFLISKGPDTAAEYLNGYRKILVKQLRAQTDKAAPEVAKAVKKLKKPTGKQRRAASYYSMRRLVGREVGDG